MAPVLVFGDFERKPNDTRGHESVFLYPAISRNIFLSCNGPKGRPRHHIEKASTRPAFHATKLRFSFRRGGGRCYSSGQQLRSSSLKNPTQLTPTQLFQVTLAEIVQIVMRIADKQNGSLATEESIAFKRRKNIPSKVS